MRLHLIKLYSSSIEAVCASDELDPNNLGVSIASTESSYNLARGQLRPQFEIRHDGKAISSIVNHALLLIP